MWASSGCPHGATVKYWQNLKITDKKASHQKYEGHPQQSNYVTKMHYLSFQLRNTSIKIMHRLTALCPPEEAKALHPSIFIVIWHNIGSKKHME